MKKKGGKMESRPTTPVAIIGMACMFPQAPDLNRYWANLREGVDAIGDIPQSHWSISDYYDPDPKAMDKTYCQRGGFLKSVEFEPREFGIAPRDMEAIDTSQLLSLLVARQALEDAGYGANGRNFDHERASVILGVTGTLKLTIPLGARLGHPIWRRALREAGVDEASAEDVVARISEGYVEWQENSFPGLLGNVTAGRIANRLDLRGTNCVVDAACASSLGALNLALMELQTGRADLVLSGGVDTFNDIFMYTCFSRTPTLSPSGQSRPFDRETDGIVLGEGIGMLVLKRLEDAEREGDRIYAVIRGLGTASDGKGQAIYAPSIEGERRAIANAYRDAGIAPESVSLIEAHGTGTPIGDATEISALNAAFGGAGERPKGIALGSVKSMIGYTKAAAGSASLIKTALALYRKVLPPTINIEAPNKAFDPAGPFYLNCQKRPWLVQKDEARRAGVSCFGFGGSDFHCVLEEYNARNDSTDWDGQVQILALSASSQEGLLRAVEAIPVREDWDSLRRFVSAARGTFDHSAAHRLTMVLEEGGPTPRDMAVEARRILLLGRESPPQGNRGKVWYGEGKKPGKLAALFPGQGSQYPGMLRDLACQFPQMKNALEAADREIGIPLSDFIYPKSVFRAEEAAIQEQNLTATDIAQPAIGAVSAGALSVLQSFNIGIDAAAGHSYGELCAHFCAGVLSEADFFRLSRLRGSLMMKGEGDRGSMLALSTDLAGAEHFIKTHGLDLVVANRNTPNQTVLSGATAEIERAEGALKTGDLRGTRLHVAAAFHSPFVAGACGPLSQELDKINLGEGVIPVYANSTGNRYPKDRLLMKEILAGQLAKPVEFVRTIENMYEDGIRTFVEIGPGRKLSGLISSILEGREAAIIAMDSSSGKSQGQADLAVLLARLSALGYEVNLTAWDGDFVAGEQKKKEGMTIKLCGANYVSQHPRRPPKEATSPKTSETGTGISTPGFELTEKAFKTLVQIQENSAKLHAQFLDGQRQAVERFRGLMERQQTIYAQTLGLSPPDLSSRETSEPLKEPAVPTAETLLQVVSEKTGYPPEMLGLDMSLDADLGIDSIKRVEILSALKQKLPDAPAIGPADLAGINTLGDLAKHLAGARTESSQRTPSPLPSETQNNTPSRDSVMATLLRVVSEKTGYSPELLEPSMELDRDLGIDSIKRVEIYAALREKLPEAPTVKPEFSAKLTTIRELADYLSVKHAETGIPEPKERSPMPETRTSRGVTYYSIEPSTMNLEQRHPRELPKDGIWVVTKTDDGLSEALIEALTGFGLRALEMEPRGPYEELTQQVAGLILPAPRASLSTEDVLHYFHCLKAAGPALKGGAERFLVGITRLDGRFGLDGLDRESNPSSAALSGLVKTAAREWPSVKAQVIDLDWNESDHKTSATHIMKILAHRCPMELGIRDNEFSGIQLKPGKLDSQALPAISENDITVISGGARGISADVAVALAAVGPSRFILWGRSPVPSREPEWAEGLTQINDLRKELLRGSETRMSPHELDETLRPILTGREIRKALSRIETSGSRPVYMQVDITDRSTVAKAVSDIKERYGAITAYFHGAGILADGLIEDKEDSDFAQVYATKVKGLENVLDALSRDTLASLVLFSSSTARFGRRGQADYAAANETLNKIAQTYGRAHPSTRVLSINWGPWDGGMVNGQLKTLFEKEGISIIDPQKGAAFLAACLSQAPGQVEYLAIGEGTRLPDMDPSSEKSMGNRAFERTISLTSHPFLRSHILGGTAVLPVAMMIEWLAHGALHGNPGFRFRGFSELRVYRGIKIAEGESIHLAVDTGKAEHKGDEFLVGTELYSLQGERRVVHAGSVIHLGEGSPVSQPGLKRLLKGQNPMSASEIYVPGRLFHGSDMHPLLELRSLEESGALAMTACKPKAEKWMASPLRKAWICDPLAMDGAFQLMILWCEQYCGAPSLPTYLHHYEQFGEGFSQEKAEIILKVLEHSSNGASADIEWLDEKGSLIARLSGYECTIDPSLADAFKRSRLGE